MLSDAKALLLLLTTRQWDKLGLSAQLFMLGVYHGINVFRGIGSYEIDTSEKETYRLRLASYRGGYVAGWILRILVVFYIGVQSDVVATAQQAKVQASRAVGGSLVVGLLTSVGYYLKAVIR